jgi:DivIVA domain-containing protein
MRCKRMLLGMTWARWRDICHAGVMRQFPAVISGYSRSEVDALFSRIDAMPGAGTTTAHTVTSAEIHAATFPTQLRGYDRNAVDAALRAALQELEYRGS